MCATADRGKVAKSGANARGSSFERRTYQGLGFLDMFMAKEELAIQVAQVNSI